MVLHGKEYATMVLIIKLKIYGVIIKPMVYSMTYELKTMGTHGLIMGPHRIPGSFNGFL